MVSFCKTRASHITFLSIDVLICKNGVAVLVTAEGSWGL